MKKAIEVKLDDERNANGEMVIAHICMKASLEDYVDGNSEEVKISSVVDTGNCGIDWSLGINMADVALKLTVGRNRDEFWDGFRALWGECKENGDGLRQAAAGGSDLPRQAAG